MFGEYAQIASYLSSIRDSATLGDFPASNLPAHLIPVPSISPPLWPGGLGALTSGTSRKGRSHDLAGSDRAYVEDFVMVAEFSEIEGPKPVLTIPKDAGSSVDKNSLSVKLMAVDHQTSSEGFSISEDTQVVLSDDESGISAFVHHFVLYDNQARGFVRPYCMVFISPDFRKIMMSFEQLSSHFKKAARFLKYGNRLLFVKDLERHLQDLEHTKGYLLNQVSRMRLKDTEKVDSEQSKARTNAENELYKGLQNIHQSTTEIRDILTILKPILHDHRLESRFRALEERAFQHGSVDVAQADKMSLQEDWFHDHLYADKTANVGGSLKESFISPVTLFKSSASHTPLLVETKKANRFNSPLRGLHELCSWGAREGLRKLRCIHEYFKRDVMVLELERNESRLMEPASSMVLHGHCITSNVLSGVFLRGSPHCVSEDSSSLQHSGDRLRRWPSIASDDTLESFKSVESYLSIQDEENASLYSFVSNNSSSGGITTSASAQDFVSAPTSPMTEEMAFPSSPPSLTTASVTTTSPTSLPQTTSSQDLPSHMSQSLASSIPGLQSLAPPAQVHEAYGAARHVADSVLLAREEVEAVELKTNSASVCSDAVVGDSILRDNTDSSTVECHHEPDLESLSPLCLRDQAVNEGGSDSSGYEILEGAVPTQDGGMYEFVNQQNCSETVSFSLENSLESSESSQQTLTGSGSDRTGTGSSRMPSFVPVMDPSPGQKIHAALDRREEPYDHQEVCGADRTKMDLTESFKSLADSLPATDDPCSDAVGNNACSRQTVSTPSSDSCPWKPRNGVYTSGDVVSSLGPGRPGHGIHEVLSTYHHLHPVLFSLMTGRTVLVIGPARMEAEVTKVVTALSIFLSETKRRQHCIVDWMNRPLKVTDLTRIRLAGICRSEKRSLDSTIPTAVKQYSTLMDVERRIINGPPYQGTMLSSVLHQKKSFKTDAQHVAYIHSWLMEMSSKAFIFYHCFCLGEAGGLTHGHGVQRHKEQYTATISCLMHRLGVRDHDITMIEHMVEAVKQAQLEPHIWANVDKGCIVHPLTISTRATQTFRC